jgi:hypothetical protein
VVAVMHLEEEARLRRRECVEFRAKLSRDTGTNLSTAECEGLLGVCFTEEGGGAGGGPAGGRGAGGGPASLQSNPGHFYTCLGQAIRSQTPPGGIGGVGGLVVPNQLKVAW